MEEQNFALKITDSVQHLRGRYLSDLRKSSHGVLKGMNGDYPSVQLKINQPDQHNKQYYILCELYNCASKNNAKCLSPNIIVHKSVIKIRNSPNRNDENDMMRYAVILEPMTYDQKDNTFKYVLKDYVIVKTKQKNDAESVLNVKREAHALDASNNYFPLISHEINDIDEMYLGYTVFEKIDENFTYKAGPEFNKIPPKYQIIQNCNPSGSFEGGYDVTLLVLGMTKKINIQIVIFDIKDDNTMGWHVEIEKENISIFKNCALTFQMPKYDNEEASNYTEDHKKCYIKLKVNNDESNALPFHYDFGILPLKKRKKASPEQKTKKCGLSPDCEKSKFEQTNKEQIRQHYGQAEYAVDKQKIYDVVLKDSTKNPLKKFQVINDVFVRQHVLGNTILHAAIATDDFLELSELLLNKLPTLNETFKNAQNRRGETLLHYACKLNKANCMHKLINLECSLLKQSTNSSTPMHFAIQNNSTECIDKLIELIDNKEACNLNEDIKRLLQIYNHQNFTILHLAVLNNCYALVECLLQFAERNCINLWEIVVPTNGNTIWHLAIEKNLSQMQQLIKLYLPDIDTYDNYAGDYLENEELSEDELS